MPTKKSATKKAKSSTKRKTTKRKSTAKKKVAKTKAAPKKRVIKSTRVKANNRNFAAAVSLATDVIYDAGKEGKSKPTWGSALRTAYAKGSALAGVRKRRTTKKRTTKKK